MKSYKWAPFLQTDPRWKNEIMWVKESVERVAKNELKMSNKKAAELVYSFPSGNVIGTEGCLLCSLAMVLKLLDKQTKISWTPKTLNSLAQEQLFYTVCGFSSVRLYADICSELTDGHVQMCAKEEYPFARGLCRERIFPPQSKLMQRYHSIDAKVRDQYAVMLKIGTYDDTFASHYVMLNPLKGNENSNQDNLFLWDPNMPAKFHGTIRGSNWRLLDAYRRMKNEVDIKSELRVQKIYDLQIQGVWLFTNETLK